MDGTSVEPPVKAPFPYFGGKRAVARTVWERLGDVDNYIEPFAGSAAMLLCRPHPPRIETLNDADCYVANFWRATQRDPESVAEHADAPVNECDLHAVHQWLVLSPASAEFRERMRTDPEYYDAKIAGRWCWGMCCWIGSGWCSAHGATKNGNRQTRMPRLSGRNGVLKLRDERRLSQNISAISYARGVHSGRPQLGDAYSRGRGVHGNDAADTCSRRREWLVDWFSRLRDRLRVVRVCCGNWLRVCDSPSVTTRLGMTGIFLDPPYSAESGRDMNLYGVDCGEVAHRVREYCIERGRDPLIRIALCGYEGEHDVLTEQHGWDVLEWKTQGGYANRGAGENRNAGRERIWFSPACLADHEPSLFKEIP